MHLRSFPVSFVAEADTDSLGIPACVSEMPVFHAAPGQWPQWLALCISGNIVNSHWQTQARFGMLTQGRIWEDMLDACLIPTQSLDSTFHTLYRKGKPRPLWSRQPWLLPAANMSKGSSQGVYYVTRVFEGEVAKMQNPVLRLSLSVDSALAQSWAAGLYFIIAADGKRCVNLGLSTMRKWATRADGARGGIKACSFQEALPFEILVHLSSEPVSDS